VARGPVRTAAGGGAAFRTEYPVGGGREEVTTTDLGGPRRREEVAGRPVFSKVCQGGGWRPSDHIGNCGRRCRFPYFLNWFQNGDPGRRLGRRLVLRAHRREEVAAARVRNGQGGG
jgi:hypothetical protein